MKANSKTPRHYKSLITHHRQMLDGTRYWQFVAMLQAEANQTTSLKRLQAIHAAMNVMRRLSEVNQEQTNEQQQ